MYLFADDVLPRWISTSVILDYDTIAGSDKFENFFVCRLPNGCDEESEEDPMGTKHKWDIGYLNGAAFKMNQIAQFHRGELITTIKKCNLSQGSQSLLIYGTTMGGIGIFLPYEKREVLNYFYIFFNFYVGCRLLYPFRNVFKTRGKVNMRQRPSELSFCV